MKGKVVPRTGRWSSRFTKPAMVPEPSLDTKIAATAGLAAAPFAKVGNAAAGKVADAVLVTIPAREWPRWPSRNVDNVTPPVPC